MHIHGWPPDFNDSFPHASVNKDGFTSELDTSEEQWKALSVRSFIREGTVKIS